MIDRLLPFSGCIFFLSLLIALFVLRCELKQLFPPLEPETPTNER